MSVSGYRLRNTLYLCVAILFSQICALAQAELYPGDPVIAGPVDFNVILIDESTVEFSWNPELLDGSEVSYFKVRNANTLLGETAENSWRLSNIDRNIDYDFSVSAVTESGEETRRSNRVYYDLPQLDQSTPDGFNALLPPLENLQAEVIDATTVQLSWTPARAHWSWAEPSDYRYAVSVGGSGIEVVNGTSYTLSDLAPQGLVQIEVSAEVPGSVAEFPVQLGSRQPTQVLVDTAAPAGTMSKGYPGFSTQYGLRTEVYSKTAAELFWEGGGSSNIYINGRLVERLQEGQSLFLDNFEPGKRTLVSVGEAWPYRYSEPSDRWRHYHDSLLMHAWIETASGDPMNPDNPDKPGGVTGLRYDIYSRAAAEIFWDRADAVPTSYRIYVNGEFLTETDGVSWYFNNLTSGTEVRVGVAAVGADGIETDVSEVVFDTGGDNDSDGDNNSDCEVTGLRASVYSTTTAEVFWDRDSAGTLYNVWLDDALLATTDAVSWYSNAYEPGSMHRFRVSKADAGCEDTESVVEFTLNGSVSDTPDQDGSPTKPGELRADVYSRTAAELFWLPSTDDGWVVGYDILRDGVTVAEKRDAKSYFDNTLSAGQQYDYTVVAIDNEGNRSESASVSVTTRGAASQSLINRQNHAELISELFQIYVGEYYTDTLDEIIQFSIEGRNDDGTYFDVYECETGSYRQELNPTSTNAGIFFEFDFDECVFDGHYHNGFISGQESARGLGFGTNEYSVRQQDASGYASYSGDFKKWISQTAFFDDIHTFETGEFTAVSVDISNSEFDLSLDQMATSFAYGSHTNSVDRAWLRGGFTTRFNDLDGPLFTVSTPVEFSYKLNIGSEPREGVEPTTETVTAELRNNWTFSTGQLKLIGEDGSTLLLDADNNNPKTVTITITSDQGTESFDQPWSLWKGDLRFADYPNIAR